MILLLALGTTTSFSVPHLAVPSGVIAHGVGSAGVVLSEGMGVFENPSLLDASRLTFTGSQWLFGTTHAALGWEGSGFGLGINYLNYGTIAGYDSLGNATGGFGAYDMTLGAALRWRFLGLACRFFQRTIGSDGDFGGLLCIGGQQRLGSARVAIKVEDLGWESSRRRLLDPRALVGFSVPVIPGVSLLVEGGFPQLTADAGIMGDYQDLRLFAGMRFLAPAPGQGEESISFSSADIGYGGGIVVEVEEYEIGYAAFRSAASMAHRFSIGLSW